MDNFEFSVRNKVFLSDTNDQFIINLIKGYIESELKTGERHSRLYAIKIFINNISGSLGEQKLSRISDFNEDVFKRQYHYYKKLTSEMGLSLESQDRTIAILIKFYVFLDNLYQENFKKRLFNSLSFNQVVLKAANYRRYLEEGYLFVYKNQFEGFPNGDKWVLYPQPERVKNIRNLRRTAFDFSSIHNPILKEELKKYIWSLSESPYDSRIRFRRLIDFINEAHLFYEKEKKLSFINSKRAIELFSSTFLILYHSKIKSSTMYAPSTKNITIAFIRSFLEFIKDKFNISDLNIKQLSYIKTEYEGGNPISIDDLKTIGQAFKEGAENSLSYKLGEIIFQLSLKTKLRTGEILSLQRDCIVSINEDQGYGMIKYYSKTSYGQMNEEILLIEHIRLIEMAIRLTQPAFELADDDLKGYVFITFDQSTNKKGIIIPFNNTYPDLYRGIIKRLYESGKIEKIYTPYNARDTYIDSAWQSVEDGNISTVEIGAITGNTASTALKHYRKRSDIKRYLEAVYEASVQDPLLSGIKLEGDDLINDMPPVQQGVGACSSNECVKTSKIDIEDSDFICLTCKHFVTSVERCDC